MLLASAERFVSFVPLRYQNMARQFLKFGVTGTIGAVVDYGSYTLLTRGLGFGLIIDVLGYPLIAANIVSVFLAICSNFFLNKYWTFRNTDEAVVKQGIGYLVLNIVTFGLNQILVSFFTFRVPLIVSLFGANADLVAKALAIGLILFVNFFGSKFIIFRQTPGR